MDAEQPKNEGGKRILSKPNMDRVRLVEQTLSGLGPFAALKILDVAVIRVRRKLILAKRQGSCSSTKGIPSEASPEISLDSFRERFPDQLTRIEVGLSQLLAFCAASCPWEDWRIQADVCMRSLVSDLGLNPDHIGDPFKESFPLDRQGRAILYRTEPQGDRYTSIR